MMAEHEVTEAGYAYIYVSNENPTHVELYFDDISVTYTPTNIIQSNEYYPFGMQTAKSWTRQGNENKYLYNAGNELNEESGLYETFYRGYDATLGKFLQVDPLADKYSSLNPYHYALNNPVLNNDPMGDEFRAPSGYSRNIGRISGGGGAGGGYMDAGGGGESMYGSLMEYSYSSRMGGLPEHMLIAKNAQRVKNGEMSHEDYVRKYGTNIGSGDNAASALEAVANNSNDGLVPLTTYNTKEYSDIESIGYNQSTQFISITDALIFLSDKYGGVTDKYGGTLFENFGQVKSFVAEAAMKLKLIVAGLGLENGQGYALPHKGNVFKGRRRTNRNFVNSRKYSYRLQGVPNYFDRSGKEFGIKIGRRNWQRATNLFLGLPTIRGYRVEKGSGRKYLVLPSDIMRLSADSFGLEIMVYDHVLNKWRD